MQLNEIKEIYEEAKQLDDLSISESELTSVDKKKCKKEIKTNRYDQHRFLIDNILDVIVEIDSDGTFLYCSPQTLKLYGYHPEELIGLNVFDFIDQEDLAKVIKKFEEAINKGELHSVEYRTRHKNGHYVLVSAKGGVFNEKGNFKMIIVVRELEEQRKFE